jgi:two-component system, chemotaxis family, protein-glutamate methylesterase/glutaminase
MRPIRVLCVDDSALVRSILEKKLNEVPDIMVVGTAPDPFVARDMIISLQPDVMTLDIEMPRMDGLEFLYKLMPQFPVRVVILSSLTPSGGELTIQALELGAIDFVTKPSSNVKGGLAAMIQELAKKIRDAIQIDVSHWKSRKMKLSASKSNILPAALKNTTDKVIAIGASTGGTEAIREVLERLPPSMPGIVVVQHMPAGFTKAFAQRLNGICKVEVKEAESGDRVFPGRALIAPGGKHMTIVRTGGEYLVQCIEGDCVNGHCPSVEVLFLSVAKYVGANAYGVMLTGMGADGASAMKIMRDNGSKNMIQDEESSVVWGMPGEAFKRGAADFCTPLARIGTDLVKLAAL